MNSSYNRALRLGLAGIILSIIIGKLINFNMPIYRNIFASAELNTITNINKERDVLGKVSEAYIRTGKINRDNILAINIEYNIDYDKDSNLFLSESAENIAEKILEENEDKELVKVDFECREIRLEEIPPKYNVIDSDDMYIGEVKECEGKAGCKEVVAIVKYTNGVKVQEKIIKEKTLIESNDWILYKGCKSPIEDGIAFLVKPIDGGCITSSYGYRWGRKHNGVDIASSEGTEIYSAFDGIVKECKYDSGYGNKIVIDHDNNIETIYAHLSKFEINSGDRVKSGELIGRVGTTGKSTGPHLHFEVRVNGSPVNPEKYIKNLD